MIVIFSMKHPFIKSTSHFMSVPASRKITKSVQIMRLHRKFFACFAYKNGVELKMERRDRGFGGNRGSFGPREMHDAVCSDCGKTTQVPFQPKEGRPVYCRDCFQNHKPQR